MGFSEPYLKLCFSKRNMARNKECQKGDWYVDLESTDLRVAAQFGEVDYSKGDMDEDTLFMMIGEFSHSISELFYRGGIEPEPSAGPGEVPS